MIRCVLEDVLQELPGSPSYQIRECSNGEEALWVCVTYVPDLVTMDLRMSGMSGLVCVRQLRARLAATQIAVVTQFDSDALRQHAQQAGADIYILKDDLEPLRRHLRLLSAISG